MCALEEERSHNGAATERKYFFYGGDEPVFVEKLQTLRASFYGKWLNKISKYLYLNILLE